MAESTLDPILAGLSYEVIEWLQSFRAERSFKDVAARFGRDERTVSQTLQKLDQAFWDSRGVHILDRELGRKTYRLTKPGEAFADGLEPAQNGIRGAIDAAIAVAHSVRVLCSSNWFMRLGELSDAMPKGSFGITPDNRRTAEIDLSFPETDPDRDIKIRCTSALMSSRQNLEVGVESRLSDRVEVLPLRIDPFQLLSVDDLALDEPVTVRGLVDAGITFIMPRGGVVWEFLDREFPGWWRLRPAQHVSVVDLDAGLKCMASSLGRRKAMVVHGLGAYDLESHGLKHAYMYDFAGADSDQLVAVIGVFHERQQNFSEQEDKYNLVWKTALKLWAKKENGR